MDPNRCYRYLLKALEEDDFDVAQSYASLLKDWLARGGFYPSSDEALVIDKTIDELLKTVSPAALSFPFTSLCCVECDAGSHLASLQQATEEGWTELEPTTSCESVRILAFVWSADTNAQISPPIHRSAVPFLDGATRVRTRRSRIRAALPV